MITSSSNRVASPVAMAALPSADAAGVQLLTCQCAGQGLAMRTDHLAGVHQLTPKELEQGVDRLETAQGSFPIVSLAELLSQHFQVSLKDDPTDRALLAIEVGDQKFALRTGGVSRPVETPPEDFKQLPKIAHPHDSNGILSGIVVIDRDAQSPVDALRLVFDPAAVLGLKSETTIPQNAASQTSSQSELPTKMTVDANSGHLLAFMPENIVSNGNFIFTLPLATIHEVTTEHEVMPIRMASDQLEGYIYWRRRPVPVIRLGRSFGMADDTASINQSSRGSRRLVVAKTPSGGAVAFYAETQIQSVRAPLGESVNPATLKNCPLIGAFETEMGVLVIPDLVSILNGTTAKAD